MILLGICGFKGSGKDTLTNYLVNNHNFIKFSFAEVTKDILSILFSWNRKLLEGDTIKSRIFRETIDPWWSEKLRIPNLTPRKTLQLIGTDLFRNNFNQDIWLRVIEKKILIELEKNPKSKIIISDCRFPNEMEMLRSIGGKIICIHRDIPDWFEKYKTGIDCKEAFELHESETSWIRQKFDFEIFNNTDTIELFEIKINDFYKLIELQLLNKYN